MPYLTEEEADAEPEYMPMHPLGIVRACALALVNHGVLPVQGGLMDQPESLWMDMMWFLNEMDDKMEELRPETNAGPGYDADDPRTWFDDPDGQQARIGLW